jgi:hypothetical protein
MKFEKLEWFLPLFNLCFLICFLPLAAYMMKYNRRLRAHAVALGGELLLKVPRPRVQRSETAMLVSEWVGFGLGAVSICVLAVSRPFPTREFAALLPVLLGFCIIAFTRDTFGRDYLEFRAHGIVCGALYSPWDSIREWRWSDSSSTLHIKLTHEIAIYRLRPGDKQAVQKLLDGHLAERALS